MSRRAGGRPTNLTPECHATIVKAVRQGMYVKSAVEGAGITEATYYRWLERGRRGEEPFESFLIDVEQASAEATLDALGVIRKAAETDWRAAAWFLERRFPGQYGKHARSSREDETVAFDSVATDAEEVLRRLGVLIAHAETEN
jgi:transposase